MSRETLTGWARTAPSVAEVVTPSCEADVLTHLASAHAVIARGLGRSYGDAAQLGGGLVMSNRALTSLSAVDQDGIVTAGSGLSIDELLREVMGKGWFVPVSPGTRQVTVGGAIAADIHGKNHHVDGSFGQHVTSMRLATPTGLRVLDPAAEPELFWASVGGLGLTGFVTEATFQLTPIETGQMVVDTDRHRDLDSVMASMATGDDGYRYSVAWIDCMAKGRSLGRAVLTRGDHATHEQAGDEPIVPPGAPKVAVPISPPAGLVNSASIRAFNELWFRRSPRQRVGELQSVAAFFHPLDGVRGWNRLYGPRGFVQYQLAVPASAGETLRRVVERLAGSRVPSFLGVLKRFGPGDRGPLSFPIAGWTLAVDLPVGPPELPGLLDALDEMVASAGGRIYLAKDSRLDPSMLERMYPRLGELVAAKDSVDPKGVITSDLARRLGIGR
jgi:decaprenylphospho-beta-D-ribofuranose 2-oxidase